MSFLKRKVNEYENQGRSAHKERERSPAAKMAAWHVHGPSCLL